MQYPQLFICIVITITGLYSLAVPFSMLLGGYGEDRTIVVPRAWKLIAIDSIQVLAGLVGIYAFLP